MHRREVEELQASRKRIVLAADAESRAIERELHDGLQQQLVTDNAMVHIMLLSRTRRTSDWALDCWDCSDRPVEELQLQVTAAPNTPAFDSPGGFLFVNWEKSTGERTSL